MPIQPLALTMPTFAIVGTCIALSLVSSIQQATGHRSNTMSEREAEQEFIRQLLEAIRNKPQTTQER
jgi:hypothetical protein